MKIAGFQKLTLLDFPEKMAAVVFTPGCNMRCGFCHNASIVLEAPEDSNEDEVLTFLKTRIGILDGVCITGGEPTLQPDLLSFIKKIKALGYAVKLDTNGTRPDVLKQAVAEGLLDYVAMDIKNTKEKYAETVGIKDFDFAPIKESIDFLLSDAVDYEFRTTVVKNFHTPDDIQDIAVMLKGAKRYFLQSFKDSGYLIGEGFVGYDENEMKSLVKMAKDTLKAAELRG